MDVHGSCRLGLGTGQFCWELLLVFLDLRVDYKVTLYGNLFEETYKMVETCESSTIPPIMWIESCLKDDMHGNISLPTTSIKNCCSNSYPMVPNSVTFRFQFLGLGVVHGIFISPENRNGNLEPRELWNSGSCCWVKKTRR